MKRFGAEIPALERPRPEVLHDHVAQLHELEERLATLGGAHVERDAALVPVGHGEAWTTTTGAIGRRRAARG